MRTDGIVGLTSACIVAAIALGIGGIPFTGPAVTQARQVPTVQVPLNQTATAVARATEARQPQPPEATPTPVSAQSTTNAPELRGFNELLLQQLRLPAGFAISIYAQGKGNVRMLAFGPDGTL